MTSSSSISKKTSPFQTVGGQPLTLWFARTLAGSIRPSANDDQINRNLFRNVVTSNAPQVTKQKPRPVISETTTLTTTDQRPRMNVNQNSQPSADDSDDIYDYGPTSKGPYSLNLQSEPYALRPIYERYQPMTTMTTAYVNPPYENPRTGAQRFNPDYQRDDYLPLPPAFVRTYPRVSVATQTCPNEMNYAYERYGNVPVTKCTATTTATATARDYMWAKMWRKEVHWN